MSKEKVISDSKDIDKADSPINNEEYLIRLLCSPLYFNEKLGIVNLDAFDLRALRSGDLEEYVSLARIKAFSSQEKIDEYLTTFGYKIWDDKKNEINNYYGYGSFKCKDAREVHGMIEINPLIGKNKFHIGLFYKHPEGGYYCGPLPKTKSEILEALTDLADLLKVEKIASKAGNQTGI